MSSDQRPARTVIIAPDARRAQPQTQPQRRAADPAADTASPTIIAPTRSRTVLFAGLFLFACVAGAVGVALAPWLMAGR